MSNLDYADPESLMVKTPDLSVQIGVDAPCCLQIRTDLNGVRIKSPSDSRIYLVDNGVLRHIPNPETYNNLFRNWDNIVIDPHIDQISMGHPISNGAILAKSATYDNVFLIDEGTKRWITSPSTMDKYNFDWGKVFILPNILLQSIPNGVNI